MDESWRYRPVLPPLPPPPFYRPPDQPPPYIDHRTATMIPPPEPLHDYAYSKRMRVEDPIHNPYPPPRPYPSDDWRLNLARESGQIHPTGNHHHHYPCPPPYRTGPGSAQQPVSHPENPRFYPHEREGFDGPVELPPYPRYGQFDARPPHYSGSYDNYNNATMFQRPPDNRVEHYSGMKRQYQEEFWKPSEPYRPISEDFGAAPSRVHSFEAFPPLPPQPPPPPPPEPSPPHYQATNSVPMPNTMLNHVRGTILEGSFGNQDGIQGYRPSFYGEPAVHSSNGLDTKLPMNQTSSKEHLDGRQEVSGSRRFCEDKPKVIDACTLFRQPHRSSRPDHFVIILRGLPGSGKSYLAKTLRDLEVEAGGKAPRIHAMDDYFMIEVEKVEDSDGSKSSTRGKKQITKKVTEYCYEPEMEEAYRSSMLKAFKKTLDEGNFTFVIVDDRNLRVADFAQFWAIAKRSGYEVYVLEAAYTDPVGCAARNVHGFTVDDIEKMAKQWEESPPLYMQLDIKSLFRGDYLNEQSIQEVDMEMDDAVCDREETTNLQHGEILNMTDTQILDDALDTGSVKIGERWNAEEEEVGVKELGRSKWSNDEGAENEDGDTNTVSALSGLVQTYGKPEKSVRWGDHVDRSGFSIGAQKRPVKSSLIIGPGSGYNLMSNPVPIEEHATTASKSNANESKRRFTEQLRVERDFCKAVLGRRHEHIDVLGNIEDEQ